MNTTTTEATTYRCTDERWDSTTTEYESAADFLDACRDSFGEAPAIREAADGRWVDDESGATVLEVVEA